MQQSNLKRPFSARNKKTLSLFMALASTAVFNTFSAHAAYTEPKGFDSLPIQTVKPVKGNDTKQLQKAINKATKQPHGGKILLKRGSYQLNGVYLKPNVHLLIEKGTILEPYAPNKRTVNFFRAGVNKGPEISNMSIRGLDGRFKIVLPDDYQNSTRAFLFGNVNNLLIENFDMVENYTKFSAIAFVVQHGGKTRQNRAKNVTVRNSTLEKSNYGYGLIQVNAGADMLFENLVSKGAGVTVRLEADLEVNNKNNIGIHNIKVNNATCINGHTALFMQPHSITNGLVEADGIVSENCGMAVFAQKNHGRFPGLQDGSFAKGSYVRDIRVTHGTTAPISFGKRNHFLPKKLHKQVKKPMVKTQSKHLLGPSIAAVINVLNDQVEIKESEIKVSGPVKAAHKEKIVTESYLEHAKINYPHKSQKKKK